MLELKEVSEKEATRYGKFSITCLGKETRIQPGDEITFLQGTTPSNVVLGRRTNDGGVKGMGIVSDNGESILGGMEKRFTREEVQLIAIVLAASFGLSLKKAVTSPYGTENITFKFVE